MNFGLILLVFAVIFIAELPDKSMFATLILGSRLPAFYVWLGAASAFFVHVIIAVTAGKLLTLLPHKAVEAVVAILFFAGAGLIFFGKHGLEDPSKRSPKHKGEVVRPGTVFATAFGVVFIGEWGDITQIATANYAAKYHDALSVGVGATLALWSVAALGILVGTKALTLVPPKVLQTITGLVLLAFGVFSAVAVFR